MGVDDDDGVAVATGRLLPQLVGDDVVHEGGLAHARAGDVEVVAAEEIAGEADGLGPARGRLAHEGALAHIPRGRQERFRSRAPDEGCLVLRTWRVPEGGRLAHADDAAAAEESPTGGMQPLGVGEDGPHAAHIEARPQGMVEVAVGGGHPLEQFPRPLAVLLGVRGREDGGHLDLGLESEP